MSEDMPELDPLLRALTADPTAAELTGQDAAMAMFRDNYARSDADRARPPQRGRRRFVPSLGMGAAAAFVVAAAFTGGAYAAVLPGPIQHIAYRVLARIGVPDAHHSGQPPAPSPLAVQHSAATATPAAAPSATPGSAACPCPPPATQISLVAVRTQIAAGGSDMLSGWLTPGGKPRARVRVRLLVRPAGPSTGWRTYATAVTGGDGNAAFVVTHLTRNTSFQLAGPGPALSTPVLVTVVPRVAVSLAGGSHAGIAALTATVQFAAEGDEVFLQTYASGAWRDVVEQQLDRAHQATFDVAAGQGQSYRVVLLATSSHAGSVSVQLHLPRGNPGSARSSRPG
jgi:hypothetical protein